MPLQASAETEIGRHLHPEHWGKGYASEAATEVLRDTLSAGIQRVIVVTAPDNLASQKVCRRIGMTPAGRTSDFYNENCELFLVVL